MQNLFECIFYGVPYLLILYALISSFPYMKILNSSATTDKFLKKEFPDNHIVCLAKMYGLTEANSFFREAQQRLYPSTTCMPGLRMPRIDNSQMNRKPAEPLPTITWQLTPTYNARQLISQILKTYFRNMLF